MDITEVKAKNIYYAGIIEKVNKDKVKKAMTNDMLNFVIFITGHDKETVLQIYEDYIKHS